MVLRHCQSPYSLRITLRYAFRVLSIPNVITKVIACSFAVAERVYILRAVQCAQDFLASRIEAFLSDFSDHLKTLDPDVFHSHVTSLVARYRESDKNIGALLQEAVDKECPPPLLGCKMASLICCR